MISKDTIERFDIKEARKIGKSVQKKGTGIPAYPYHSVMDNLFVAYEYCYGEIPDKDQFLKAMVQEIVEEGRYGLRDMIVKYDQLHDQIKQHEFELRELKHMINLMKPNLNNPGFGDVEK
jgi:hypothetical protein